jgi:hypothetical protein
MGIDNQPPESYDVIALAGRRTDEPNAKEVRFPSENIPAVKKKLRELFKRTQARVIVSSVAAGADLLALDTAGSLGIRRLIVLPIEKEKFLHDSVADKGRAWVHLFNSVVAGVDKDLDIILMDRLESNLETFLDCNERILDEAIAIAGQGSSTYADATARVLAVVVWNERSRGEDDVTAAFADSASKRGIRVFSISSLGSEEEG